MEEVYPRGEVLFVGTEHSQVFNKSVRSYLSGEGFNIVDLHSAPSPSHIPFVVFAYDATGANNLADNVSTIAELYASTIQPTVIFILSDPDLEGYDKHHIERLMIDSDFKIESYAWVSLDRLKSTPAEEHFPNAGRAPPREFTSDDLILTFDSQLTPDQIVATLAALADYYRGCGGVGLPADFETQEATVLEDAHV